MTGNLLKENRVCRFAGGLQEACWLAAGIVVPLVFNARGSTLVYQPFKFGAWILLALVGVAAWMVQSAGKTRTAAPKEMRTRSVAFTPLGFVLIGLAVSCTLSSVLSLDPQQSLRGAPGTFEGLVTQLAMIALAALVAFNLRTKEQFERLAWAMILAGFAAGLAAILQRTGLNPHVPELRGERCEGTAGHSIYLGGYLVMVIPLTLQRLLASRRLAGSARWLTLMTGGIILAVQVAGFVCAESRGPTIAMGAMLLAFVWFHAVWRRSRRLIASLLVACLLAGVGTGLLASGSVPAQWSEHIPILKRFARSKSIEEGVDGYRPGMWKQMPGMMATARPLPKPSGGSDPHHGLRAVVGYGPETLELVFPQVRTLQQTQMQENRFHNMVWDRLYAFGAFGLAAYLALWLLTFQRGFQLLGWHGWQGRSTGFWLTVGGITTLSAITCGLVWNSGFIGLGILCGMAAGTLIFSVAYGFRARETIHQAPPGALSAGWIIALLAALAGHAVDMSFAFFSAPTALMFWLMVGMVHAAQRGLEDDAGDLALDNTSDTEAASIRTGRGFVLADIALVALGAVTLLFSFMHRYSYDPLSVRDVLEWSLFHPKIEDGRASLLGIVPLALVLFGGLLPVRTTGGVRWRRVFGVSATALCVATGYAWMQAWEIVSIGSFPPPTLAESGVLKMTAGYERLFMDYLWYGGLLVALAGLGLAWRPVAVGRTALRSWLVALPASLLVIGIGLPFVVRPLRANLLSEWGSALQALGRGQFSPAVFRLAVVTDPHAFVHRGLLANALVFSASLVQGPVEAAKLYAEAEKTLLEGRSISDLNRSHYFLGMLYLQRGLGEAKPNLDTTAAQAAQAFARAAVFEPHQEIVWTYASVCDRLLLDDAVAADAKLGHAMKLASEVPDVAAARYLALANSTVNVRLRREFARIASKYCDILGATPDRMAANRAKFEKAKLLMSEMEDLGTVESLLNEVVEEPPADIEWQAHGMLGQVLLMRRQIPDARRHLKVSMDKAPEKMREPISRLLKQLEGQP